MKDTKAMTGGWREKQNFSSSENFAFSGFEIAVL